MKFDVGGYAYLVHPSSGGRRALVRIVSVHEPPHYGFYEDIELPSYDVSVVEVLNLEFGRLRVGAPFSCVSEEYLNPEEPLKRLARVVSNNE